jgi:alanine racemase
MPRPTTATVRLSALRANLQRARALAPGSRIWAVVKANAYGHGLLEAMRAFSEADGLALVEFDGATRLRDAGYARPILMLEGAFDAEDVEQAAAQGLVLVIHCAEQVDWLAAHRGPPIDVYIKLNTGMNRLGMSTDELPSLFARVTGLAAVRSVSLMTHFANADLPGGAHSQLECFEQTTVGMPGVHSLANSSAIFDLPETHRDWVRPGIMLYGGSPFSDRTGRELGLQAAMALESRLLAIQTLAPGDAVGYGSTFVADRPMRIGIVACGYADGYPRHAPTGTPIAVGGVRTRTVGRVSMDMLAVDLKPVPLARVGARVELWGDSIAVDEVAHHAGTIAYELLCAVAPRVRREVLDDGPAIQDPVRL